MAINKVVYGNDTLIDLTNDTVEASNLLEGETAHDRSGNPVTGTAKQGHIVQNNSGTDMTQRSKLQFVGVYTEDDSTNNRTKVNIVREMTKEQMDALSSDEKKGFIRTTNEPDAPYSAISNAEVNFTEASERTNIASGESISTLFGKIKKWFTDLPSMFVSKSGGTVSGDFTVDRANGTTSTVGYGLINVGNMLSEGTEKNAQGLIDIFGTTQYRSRIKAGALTGHRAVELPDKSGTIALTSDVLLNFGTPFYYPNNSLNARRFRFSDLGSNEAIQLLLFTRYGAYIIRGACAASGFSSVNAYPLYSDALALTITNVTGYEFLVTIGTWCAIYGLYVHPHYPNSVLTITPESV